MVEFSWVPIPNEKIGTVYLLLCDIEIQNSYGEWQTFTSKLDTGADMTLMEENDYYSLGYTFDNNQEMNFTTVDNREISRKVGNLNMKIDGHIINEVPVAFSKEPVKTLLLGRLRIFDPFEICFDNIIKQTTIRHSSTESLQPSAYVISTADFIST
jgi:hypothetical protein